jgi:hypothetical protein
MYSAADYLEMIIIFRECERNAREAARVFEEGLQHIFFLLHYS